MKYNNTASIQNIINSISIDFFGNQKTAPAFDPYTDSSYTELADTVLHNLIFYVYDHLGNTRVTYEPVLDPTDSTISYNLKGVFDYYPYGKILRKYEFENEKYLTTQHQRDIETGFDYRGARFYDADVARFLSVDPLAKKFAEWSTYNYVVANPLRYIDEDGKEIVVPDECQRAEILNMINSKAAGSFKFDDNGKLYQYESGSPETGSTYYAEKLIEGIESGKTISVAIQKTIKLPISIAADGKTIVYDQTKTMDVDADGGGGITAHSEGTNADVYISGNENKNLKDENGNPLEDTPADILMHELVSHAIPTVTGNDQGNAVVEENKVRAEYPKGKQQQRAPCPSCQP